MHNRKRTKPAVSHTEEDGENFLQEDDTTSSGRNFSPRCAALFGKDAAGGKTVHGYQWVLPWEIVFKMAQAADGLPACQGA